MKLTLRIRNEGNIPHVVGFRFHELVGGLGDDSDAGVVLRDDKGQVVAGITVSAAFWAEIERKIIEQHHARVQAAMLKALRTGEPAQPPSGVMASFEALKAEHTRLRAMYADLTSRHEALQRDFKAELSASRVPRSSDMADVVRAQTTG